MLSTIEGCPGIAEAEGPMPGPPACLRAGGGHMSRWRARGAAVTHVCGAFTRKAHGCCLCCSRRLMMSSKSSPGAARRRGHRLMQEHGTVGSCSPMARCATSIVRGLRDEAPTEGPPGGLGDACARTSSPFRRTPHNQRRAMVRAAARFPLASSLAAPGSRRWPRPDGLVIDKRRPHG